MLPPVLPWYMLHSSLKDVRVTSQRGRFRRNTNIYWREVHAANKYSTSSTCQFNYTDHACLQPLPKPTAKGRHFPDASFHKNCSYWKIPVIIPRVRKVILETTTEMEVYSIICGTLWFFFIYSFHPQLKISKGKNKKCPEFGHSWSPTRRRMLTMPFNANTSH